MKKKLLFLFIILMCAGFTGCFVEKLPVTDREMDIIAQYSADVLLRHDRNYETGFMGVAALTPTPTSYLAPRATEPVPTEAPEVTETPEPTDEPEPTEAPEITDAPEPEETPVPTEKPLPTDTPTPTPFPENTEYTNEELTNVIGAWDGLYAEYIGTSEPVKEFTMGDSATALTRDPGYEYIIAKFTVYNDNDDVVYLDTASQELKCLLMYNHGETKSAEITLFTNDLRFIGANGSDDWSFGEPINPGKSYDAILVFKVPENTELDQAAIAIMNSADESVIIKIK